ncbi:MULTISPECIES: hypothetical protein [Francisella]|uniref:hypothetical protein n=1 Tax=Francisella TaxID=262 RepID=UPI001908693B|nr:hypothetical protein [Francisella philomiragia]MBK2266927.1 hypothetical protein [Francisella philomiragia]MBK2278575.1 hypothetical protein [Francisella philomiragia]MBK2286236.1 hypothetical protein [Francisella philomiragia]MBK2288405.1 hypothetical protein [Francisella philomiragia]MBK2291048.1 hypothetical protein [Francisella philomiragia]
MSKKKKNYKREFIALIATVVIVFGVIAMIPKVTPKIADHIMKPFKEKAISQKSS